LATIDVAVVFNREKLKKKILGCVSVTGLFKSHINYLSFPSGWREQRMFLDEMKAFFSHGTRTGTVSASGILHRAMNLNCKSNLALFIFTQDEEISKINLNEVRG
jgi:hypothetical protein